MFEVDPTLPIVVIGPTLPIHFPVIGIDLVDPIVCPFLNVLLQLLELLIFLNFPLRSKIKRLPTTVINTINFLTIYIHLLFSFLIPHFWT